MNFIFLMKVELSFIASKALVLPYSSEVQLLVSICAEMSFIVYIQFSYIIRYK